MNFAQAVHPEALAIDPQFAWQTKVLFVVKEKRGYDPGLRNRIIAAANGATLPELMECGDKPKSAKAMVGKLRRDGVLRVEGERGAFRYFAA